MRMHKSKSISGTICPVCGECELGWYEICPVCHWENDRSQIESPDETGANEVTLNQARKAWANWKNEHK